MHQKVPIWFKVLICNLNLQKSTSKGANSNIQHADETRRCRNLPGLRKIPKGAEKYPKIAQGAEKIPNFEQRCGNCEFPDTIPPILLFLSTSALSMHIYKWCWVAIDHRLSCFIFCACDSSWWLSHCLCAILGLTWATQTGKLHIWHLKQSPSRFSTLNMLLPRRRLAQTTQLYRR